MCERSLLRKIEAFLALVDAVSLPPHDASPRERLRAHIETLMDRDLLHTFRCVNHRRRMLTRSARWRDEDLSDTSTEENGYSSDDSEADALCRRFNSDGSVEEYAP